MTLSLLISYRCVLVVEIGGDRRFFIWKNEEKRPEHVRLVLKLD
ncbi:unnamed protein product [Caenorhabditis auriculariae]|uniref:Uncharacterized protein n=1 Tax=Caenorhabditis auriculariae TaxID=2777116 RepID=A0A8S1HFJ8_9PELO|nr:unnamed protein product [Caenorhabditis auriculariae]